MGSSCSDPVLASLVHRCLAGVFGAGDGSMGAGALRIELEAQVGIWADGDGVATRRKVPGAIRLVAIWRPASTVPTDPEVGRVRVAVDFEHRLQFANPPPGNQRRLQQKPADRLLVDRLGGIVSARENAVAYE